MEHTEAQRKRIKQLKDDFGSRVIKPHAPNYINGHMMVEVQSQAGTWLWYFDREGEFVTKSMALRLFDPPDPPRNPRNAIDN